MGRPAGCADGRPRVSMLPRCRRTRRGPLFPSGRVVSRAAHARTAGGERAAWWGLEALIGRGGWIVALDGYRPPTCGWAPTGSAQAPGVLAGGRLRAANMRNVLARPSAIGTIEMSRSLFSPGRELLGRWIADPGDGGRRPSHPPPAAHEPERVPRLRIQPAPPEQEDDAPHAGAADAVSRVAVEPCPHRWGSDRGI